MKRKIFAAVFAFVLALGCAVGVSACGGTKDPTVHVESVTLSSSSLDLQIGEEAVLTATVLPSDATDKTVGWQSDDPSVATVNNGRVKAVAAGSATITATADGKNATCSVTVTGGTTHQHEYSPLWSSDDEHHWHAATCVHTEEMSDYAAHTYKNGVCEICLHEHVNHTFEGDRCSVCGLSVEFSKLRYEKADGQEGYSVIGWDESVTDRTHIFIPAEYEGSPVVSIGESAFDVDDGDGDETLATVFLPETVKEIGAYAFYHCTGLTSINIENVETIGKGVFSGCSSLDGICFGSGITSITDTAFYQCSSLKSVEIPANVKTIEKNAFRESGLETVTLNEGLQTIGENAFYKCASLNDVRIPASIETFEKNTFRESGLKTVTLNEGLQTIGENAFYKCASLNDVRIPASIETFGKNAFRESGLKTVILNEGLRTIGENAFYKCLLLKEVHIPSSIQTWGTYTFSGCAELKTVTFSEGLSSIGEAAFNSCELLDEVTVPAGLAVGKGAFKSSGLRRLTVEANATLAFESFGFCRQLEEVTLSGEVDCKSFAFTNSTAIQRVNVESLADWCNMSFGNSYATPLCGGAKLYVDGTAIEGDLVIPEGVKKVGDYAFMNYSYIHRIVLADSVEELGKCAFDSVECYSLVVGKNLKDYVGYNTDHSGSTLTTNTFDSIFYNSLIELCNRSSLDIKMGDVSIPSKENRGSIEEVDGFLFYVNRTIDACLLLKYTGDELTALPAQSPLGANGTYIIRRDFAENSGLNSTSIADTLIIPDCVTEIGNSAFTTIDFNVVVIGSGVKKISGNAFVGLQGATCVSKLFYHGTEEEWNSFDNGVDDAFHQFNDTEFYFYSDTQKTGRYWHYGGSGEPVEW